MVSDLFGRNRRAARVALIALVALLSAGRSGAAAPAEMTYIHELGHPRVVVHYHPRAGQQFLLAHARYALDQQCHGLELDLHMRGGEVVCNHDGPTPEAPRLADVLDLIVARKGTSPAVYPDGFQFFLVLEPKDNDPALFDAVADTLDRYKAHLSTAVGSNDGPRGITAVITGAHLIPFYEHFRGQGARLNRLCIVENHDYTREIVNRSPGQSRFQWTAVPYPGQRGRVEALHEGADPALAGRYNIRVWNGGSHLAEILASGADSVNCDYEQVAGFRDLVRKTLLP